MKLCKCGKELGKNKQKWCSEKCPENLKLINARQKIYWEKRKLGIPTARKPKKIVEKPLEDFRKNGRCKRCSAILKVPQCEWCIGDIKRLAESKESSKI